ASGSTLLAAHQLNRYGVEIDPGCVAVTRAPGGAGPPTRSCSMPGKSRHIDGTRQAKTRPSRLTDVVLGLIARWLGREIWRLKKLGVSFAAAARMITQAAHGDRNGVQLPDSNVVRLPPNYSVTAMGCCKALQRALNREPALAAEDYREVDTRRLEDW